MKCNKWPYSVKIFLQYVTFKVKLLSMRKVNSVLIKQRLREMGDSARAQVSLDAKVSVSIIDKMAAGTYPNAPKVKTMERLSKAMRIKLDELFPLVGAKGRAS